MRCIRLLDPILKGIYARNTKSITIRTCRSRCQILRSPDAKIVIYCDGYEYHSDSNSFQKDRQQSRELQIKGWIVLRFGGAEILNDTDAVVFTIQRAIKQKLAQRADRLTLAEVNQRYRTDEKKPEGGICGAIVGAFIVVVVVIILLGIFIG